MGLVVLALASAALVTGAGGAHGATGGDGGTVEPGGGTGGTGGEHGYSMRTDARFAPPGAFVPSAAVTYDMRLVPAGSRIEVGQRSSERGATTVKVRLTGLKAGHEYGAHVHRKPCGADPAAAGGHYQHRPSTDPASMNPDNEVWLDFTADARGAGGASARHDWNFRFGEAASVVLHGEQGGSGVRLACFTVPFGGA
ncbi:superoxide dismutase family protein [Streptomyces sp. ActVer]|uniref:superoxide dismutase family protein n=1 Tax=Streptomyces sp. ActVer TaxID=3014558 RepID=UPI0022B3C78F|nr:superoxide dismutase family protein [Streptomyces sp. ActVer]MCZ4515191.1 superoxide dismutase family protein [Streptomyces sp. ActVer]